MITAVSQRDFYREFLMKRGTFEPSDFGLDIPKTEFIDDLVTAFGEYTHGQISLDELLLRPRAAMDFCDATRRKFCWYDVPDDIMLRSIMNARKNPTA